jgi:transketolase
MMKTAGISYIRTIRDATPVLYTEKDSFPIGGSKIFEAKMDPRIKSEDDKKIITIVATGVTVHEALAAQQELAKENISVRVIDCYSIKPIDAAVLQKAAGDSTALVVVEDHHPEGGLGEAVLSAVKENPVKIIHLAVSKTPRSGKPSELLAYEGIDAGGIIQAIRDIGKK